MVEINNLTTSPRTDEGFLRRVAEKVLKGENKKDSELSIALIGQGKMRKLNKKYRGKNRVTDVLAFPNKEIGLGEIVICLREVKKNAKRYGLTFEKELSRVLIHGLLHLLGYDHEISEKKTKEMEEKQNYYISRIFTN